MKINIKKDIAISDSGFVFNPTNGESFSVNPLGIEIINLLKEDKAYDEIKKSLLPVYQTDEATFEKDYFDFIAVLKHHHILEDKDNG